MINDQKDIPRPTREAADWYARLSQPCIEVDELEAFSAWRQAPENAAAYERIEDIARTVREMGDDPDMRAAAAEALTRGPEHPPFRPRPRAPRTRLILGVLAAASVIAAIGGGYAVLRPTYATAVGETFSARLSDGSRLTLDTDSQVRVRFSDGVRRVELLRGQAMFEVAHNAQRPFVVAAGSTQVRALGTRFEVRKIGADVRVTLTQGSVEVTDPSAHRAAWRLAPGQALALTPTTAQHARPTPVDVQVATSWTTGNLTFQGLPLSAAVAELNRYSRDKIVLGEGTPTDRRVSGVFAAGDTADFVAAVSSVFDLQSVRRPNGDIELRPVTEPGA